MVTEFDGMYSRLDSSRIGRTDRFDKQYRSGLVLRMLTLKRNIKIRKYALY